MNLKFATCLILVVAIISIGPGDFGGDEPRPAYQPPDLPRKDIIDLHFHGACASEKHGCYISAQARKKFFGLKFSAYLKSFGLTRADIEQQRDAEIFRQAHLRVRDSRYISQAVVLAMDGVYDSDGNLDKDRSQVYFPNEYVNEQVANYDNLLFGASVNPERKNAITDLYAAKRMGALLIKWLPCTMQFDPADEKHREFYLTLVRLKLPLLSHVGKESSIDNSVDELCDPARLELPLRLGVTVIAAHMASLGSYQGQPAYLRLQRLMEKYQNLYVDNSATLMRNRPVDFLRRANFAGRVTHGSDYPVLAVNILGYPLQPLSRYNAYLDDNWKRFIHLELTSFLDKDVAMKKALGQAEEDFYLARKLLDIPR